MPYLFLILYSVTKQQKTLAFHVLFTLKDVLYYEIL